MGKKEKKKGKRLVLHLDAMTDPANQEKDRIYLSMPKKAIDNFVHDLIWGAPPKPVERHHPHPLLASLFAEPAAG